VNARRTITRALAAITLLSIGACSRCRKRDDVKKPDDESIVAPHAFDTLAEGCDELARLRCARFSSCSPRFFFEEFGDDAFCRQDLAARCKVRASSKASGATVDALRACAHDVAHSTCDELRRDVRRVCDWPAGTIAEGDACVFDEECTTGWCEPSHDAAFNPFPCGRCRVPKKEGEACDFYDCAPGLQCGVKQHCERPVDNGACADDSGCVSWKSCIGNVCVDDAHLGERCDTDGNAPRCNPWESLRCNERHADGTWSCVAATFVKEGESCGWDRNTKLECPGTTWCRYPPSSPSAPLDVNRLGTCVAYLAIGASCADEADRFGCATPAMCIDGKCGVPSLDVCTPR
jgi:hypothetical protein